MPTLWFVVPAHGREALTAICLRQLRRTCDELSDNGIEATAVVVADMMNLGGLMDRLGEDLLGFGTVERDNQFLSRRFNDGIQLACDPAFNSRPADYVVPCGSDDWVDHRIFLELPTRDTVLGFQQLSFVRPDGFEISFTGVKYPGGCGIRVYPREVVARMGYRPADEDRYRGCDTSILTNLQRAHRDTLRLAYREIDPRQIVDWKSPEEQVTPYDSIVSRHPSVRKLDPFSVLAKFYPTEALSEMEAHYAQVAELVPA